MGIRQFCRPDDFVPAGVEFPVCDILPDWCAKQNRLLQHDTDVSSERFYLEVVHVFPIDADVA
jgi:hypothetical protein